jgi:murein DD-endopeptidase MepM/ murein hydrolase activator NlpD
MAGLQDFLNALSSQESGGSYSAVNKHTGALGRWQVLPSNVAPWARRYLGMNISAQQFLRNPALQDKLVGAVLRSYVDKYGYRGAAAAWYSGNPTLENNYNKQKWGPSVGEYVDSVMSRMSKSPFTSAATSIADTVKTTAQSVVQSAPDFKADPLQIGQGLIPNDMAADRKEPNAVKGIGLTLSDGSGEGQAGMNTPLGYDAPDAAKGDPEIPGLPVDVSPTNALSNAANSAIMVAANTVKGIKYYNPLPGFKPSGTWGSYPGSGGRHLALDFAVPQGTAVHAPLSGTVVYAGWDPNGKGHNGGFGLHLRIRNDDGSYVILGHLSSIGNLKVGTRVNGNQVIARSGSTGNSTGPHLHMEFRHAEWDPSSAFNFTSLFRW